MIQTFSTWIYNCLIWFYTYIPNLGWVIILFTLVFRLILLAFTWKSTKQSKQIQLMSAELNELKKRYQDDPKTLQIKTLELNQKYNINPLTGCLPQLLQIAVLIFLYQALYNFIQNPYINGVAVNTQFFVWNLVEKDHFYILPIIAGLTQFLLSLLMTPGTQTRNLVPDNAQDKALQEVNKKEEGVAGMAAGMQKQMIFMMPLMTTFIGFGLPSGLVLYWIAGTVFTLLQQGFINGWEGLMFWKNFGPWRQQHVAQIINQKSISKSKPKLLTKKTQKTSCIESDFTQAFKKSTATPFSSPKKTSKNGRLKIKNPPQKVNKKNNKKA